MRKSGFALLFFSSLLMLAGCQSSQIILSSVGSAADSLSSSASASSVSSDSSSAPQTTSGSAASLTSSSAETETTVLVSTFVAGDYLGADITSGYFFNQTIGVTPGTVIDSSGKTFSIDGKTISSKGRLKLSGAGSTLSHGVEIKVSGKATLRFVAQSASSKDETRTWTIADESGSEEYTSENGVDPLSPETDTYELAAAGTYYLYSKVNGINIYYIDVTQTVELGNEVGFEADTANIKTDYLPGDSLDLSGLSVLSVYSSGVKMEIGSDDYSVDASDFNGNVPGRYTIKIMYKSYTSVSFDVTVHAIQGLVSYYKAIMAGAGSKTVYRIPEVCIVGSSIDTSHLIVKAKTTDGLEIPVTDFSISLPDTSKPGAASIGISLARAGETYSTSIHIAIVDSDLLTADASGTYVVRTDPSVTDGSVVNGIVEFTDIQKAHDYLKAAAPKESSKKIEIVPGTYNEKLYIEIPHLSLIGTDLTQKTVIQYGLYSNCKDPNGTAWSTYGSSSVTVTAAATGFSATGLTFRNSSFETMDDYISCTDSNRQACAIVVDADQSSFKACGFIGFQDTLYARLGSQYYTDCRITGMTDYIFGEDSSVWIKDSEIISRNRKSTSNGGYICVPKPSSTPAVGFVIDSCSITGEDGVAPGTVSLGRPWGQLAKVSYVNCSMDKAISLSAYPSSSVNARWEAMSANTPAKADFSEYGNSGDGAISTAVAGGKIMTEEEYDSLESDIVALFSWLS